MRKISLFLSIKDLFFWNSWERFKIFTFGARIVKHYSWECCIWQVLIIKEDTKSIRFIWKIIMFFKFIITQLDVKSIPDNLHNTLSWSLKIQAKNNWSCVLYKFCRKIGSRIHRRLTRVAFRIWLISFLIWEKLMTKKLWVLWLIKYLQMFWLKVILKNYRMKAFLKLVYLEWGIMNKVFTKMEESG